MSTARVTASVATAFLVAVGAASSVQAQSVNVSLTVDNAYALYSGVPSALTLRGSNADWTTVESYSFSEAAGSYVYVAGWDFGGIQGFQGVAAGSGGTYRTNLTDWVAAFVPASQLPGWSPTGPAVPTLASLQTALTAASWQPILSSVPHSAGPWGGRVSDPGTLWIWSDSIEAGNTSNGLVVFRTAGTIVSEIPEPSTGLLMLLGAGAMTFLYRRRVDQTAG